MSVVDAAKRLALRQVGGVSGLADRMKVNSNTLFHKLAGQSGHNLFARELELMTMLTVDPEIAQELAFLCNHVCMPVPPAVIEGELGSEIAAVGKEFGGVMQATLQAIEDGRVTARELAEYDRQFNEFLGAAVRLRSALKAKIPAPPGLQVAK